MRVALLGAQHRGGAALGAHRVCAHQLHLGHDADVHPAVQARADLHRGPQAGKPRAEDQHVVGQGLSHRDLPAGFGQKPESGFRTQDSGRHACQAESRSSSNEGERGRRGADHWGAGGFYLQRQATARNARQCGRRIPGAAPSWCKPEKALTGEDLAGIEPGFSTGFSTVSVEDCPPSLAGSCSFYFPPRHIARPYSRRNRAMLAIEISFGQTASHSPSFEQLPNPSASICVTIAATRRAALRPVPGAAARGARSWRRRRGRPTRSCTPPRTRRRRCRRPSPSRPRRGPAGTGMELASRRPADVDRDVAPGRDDRDPCALRSTIRSFVCGNARARHGSTVIVSPSEK